MVRTEDQHELNEAPLLKGMPKLDPFIVPDGFFDGLPHRVQERITSRQSQKAGVWSILWSRPRPALSVLAIAVLVTVIWVYWPASGPLDEPTYSLTVGPGEVLDPVADEELLYAMAASGQPLLDVPYLPLEEAELEAYIEHEEIPLDLLIEEL